MGDVVRNTWGVMWHSKNWLDGERKSLMNHNDTGLPALFRSRREARAWVKDRYGYILERPDLKKQPHGWFQPYPVKVEIRAYFEGCEDGCYCCAYRDEAMDSGICTRGKSMKFTSCGLTEKLPRK